MKVSFGELTLDTETRQLRRGAAEVHVSPKAFELLAVLVEWRPRALSKADLQEQLWPDTYVSESNLASLVAEIRRAIGDDARTPRFVRTVQRFGYAFAGETSLAAAPLSSTATCWIISGDRQWTLKDGQHILGRGQDPGGFESDTMSRRHARILVSEGKATLEDLGSKNGTFIGDRSVTSPQTLNDGDHIRLGSVRLTFRAASGGPSTRTERP
ncbi:MAG: winged helix-turn-helix domain-containing protein [Vicinamibacterales bacterium]